VVESIRLPATMDSLEDLVRFLQSACSKREVAEDDVRVLALVTDELASNICRYAYPSGAGEFELAILFEAERCTLQFIDQGFPFDPTRQAPPDTEASLEDRGIGGLGILIVRENSERFEYERRDDTNVVTVRTRLGSGVSSRATSGS